MKIAFLDDEVWWLRTELMERYKYYRSCPASASLTSLPACEKQLNYLAKWIRKLNASLRQRYGQGIFQEEVHAGKWTVEMSHYQP